MGAVHSRPRHMAGLTQGIRPYTVGGFAMPNPSPPLLTPTDLARALGKSESYIRNALTHGRGIGTKIPPVVYVGNAPRWQPADLNEWLSAHRVGAATPPPARTWTWATVAPRNCRRQAAHRARKVKNPPGSLRGRGGRGGGTSFKWTFE